MKNILKILGTGLGIMISIIAFVFNPDIVDFVSDCCKEIYSMFTDHPFFRGLCFLGFSLFHP